MRLIGRYTFEALQKAIQGVFGFSKKDNDYVLELFAIKFVITPNVSVTIYVRNSQDYIEIGTFKLN